MKKIMYCFLAVLMIAQVSCSSGQEAKKGEVFIQGKVNNPQDAYIYLSQATGLQNIKLLDSVRADKEGTFSFSIPVKEAALYALSFYRQQQGIFVLTPETQKIEVTADGNQPRGTFEVKGSKDTDHLYEFMKWSEVATRTKDSIAQTAQSQQQYDQGVKEWQTKTTAEAKKFIDKFGNSLVTVFPLAAVDPQTDGDFIMAQLEKLKQAYPASAYVAEHNQLLTNQVNIALAKANIAAGKAAPEINLPSPDGQQVALSSLRGKYVLIDFWASWCGPCRQENPNVVKLYSQYKDKGFEIFGVSLDRDKNAWLAAIQKDGLGWKHVSDLKHWQSSVVPLYGVEGIPMTVLLDKNGVIIAKNLRGQALEEKLAEVLK